VTTKTQLLEVVACLRDVLAVLDKTATQLEAESPALKEVGYWSQYDAQAVRRAKTLVSTLLPFPQNVIAPLTGESRDPAPTSALPLSLQADPFVDCGEGPWDKADDADFFARAEVGLPYQICGINGKWHVYVEKR
jgi:hypothetical protein